MSKKTLYIIAYDIPQNNRRTKLHKVLCGYGTWTQYSLFECWLSAKQYLELRTKISTLIEESEDCVRLYTMCTSCLDSTITLGSPKPAETTVYFI